MVIGPNPPRHRVGIPVILGFNLVHLLLKSALVAGGRSTQCWLEITLLAMRRICFEVHTTGHTVWAKVIWEWIRGTECMPSVTLCIWFCMQLISWVHEIGCDISESVAALEGQGQIWDKLSLHMAGGAIARFIPHHPSLET